NKGGMLMASGGEPFSDPLYLAPDGQWLDAAAYQQAIGTSPPQGPFTRPPIPTISPAKEQFTNGAGLRVPMPRNRGLYNSSFGTGGYRVIGDLLSPAATLFVAVHPLVVWLPWPELADPQRSQLVTALQSASNLV